MPHEVEREFSRSLSLTQHRQYTVAVIAARTSLLRGILFFAALAIFSRPAPLAAADAAGATFSQDLTLRAWTKQQGLPDDSVTSVLQTRDGYLWVGTSSGLARFDGLRFDLVSPGNSWRWAGAAGETVSASVTYPVGGVVERS